MIKVNVVIKVDNGEIKCGKIEINANYSIKEIVHHLLKDINTDSDFKFHVDSSKTYTLAIAPENINISASRIKFEEGCTVYLVEVPDKLVAKVVDI